MKLLVYISYLSDLHIIAPHSVCQGAKYLSKDQHNVWTHSGTLAEMPLLFLVVCITAIKGVVSIMPCLALPNLYKFYSMHAYMVFIELVDRLKLELHCTIK